MLFRSVVFRRVPRFMRNSYVIILIAFMLWMLLFDRNDIFSQARLREKLSRLREDSEYYKIENEKNKAALRSLVTDPENLERFARERYLMKKENEEIFVIVEKD